jgi:hypothetical protein
MDGPQADDDRETEAPACTTGDARMDAVYFFSSEIEAAAWAGAASARRESIKLPYLPWQICIGERP